MHITEVVKMKIPLEKKREISEDYVYTKETEKRDFTTHFLKLPFVRVYNKQIA